MSSRSYWSTFFVRIHGWSLINTRIHRKIKVNGSVESFSWQCSHTQLHLSPTLMISPYDSLEIYVDDWWSELWLWCKINYGHGLCVESSKRWWKSFWILIWLFFFLVFMRGCYDCIQPYISFAMDGSLPNFLNIFFLIFTNFHKFSKKKKLSNHPLQSNHDLPISYSFSLNT